MKYERVSHKLTELICLNMKQGLYDKVIITKQPKYLFEKISFSTDVHHLNIRQKSSMLTTYRLLTFLQSLYRIMSLNYIMICRFMSNCLICPGSR